MNLTFDNSDTLKGKLERLEEDIESLRDQIDGQEGVIEEAEALSERLGDELSDLLQDRDDLEALSMSMKNDTTYDTMFGDILVLGEGLGWNKYCSVVRDPHEKLRFAESDHLVLVLLGDTIWGCDDFVPCTGSELTFLSEGIS